MRTRTAGVLALAVSALAAGTLALAPAAAAAPAAVGSATAEAAAAGRADGLRVAVAVTDTSTGVTTTAGEPDALFPSESVVKVLIATRLLVDGGLTAETAPLAAAMISASDDDAANRLWGLVGGPDVVAWAAERYGVTGLGAPSEWGWWGNTKVSATGLAALYTAVRADPAVAGWLLPRLGAMTAVATDGTAQTFGLGAAAVRADALVKQGWGGDDDAESTANLLSTGYLDGGRFAVALIVQDPAGGSTTALVPAIDSLAAAVVADTTAALEAQASAAADLAADEVVADATPPTSAPVGGASAAVGDGPWWPASVTVVGAAALLALLTVALSGGRRRRATARPS